VDLATISINQLISHYKKHNVRNSLVVVHDLNVVHASKVVPATKGGPP